MKLTPLFLAALLGAARAAEVVTGPPGLDASSYLGTLPLSPLTPMLEQMPLKNRLDLSVRFRNDTGALAAYTGGTVTFRTADGQSLMAAPLSKSEFLERATLSSAPGFQQGQVHVFFSSHNNVTLTGLARSLLDGRIVAGGWGDRVDNGNRQFIVARLLIDGTLDASFDTNGLKAAAFGQANAVAMQNDGKIVVAGTYGADFRVQRLNFDGSDDDTFGNGGTRTTPLGAQAEALAVAVDGAGRVVVVGRVHSGGVWQLALVRYLSTGVLDSTFDGDGIVTTDVGTSTSEAALALAIDASNRPVVAGWATVSGRRRMLVARYRTGGQLDTAFGGTGVVVSAFTGASDVEARAVAIDGSGRIVAGGAATIAAEQRFAVARFTAAGAFDATFSGDGQAIIDFARTSDEGFAGIATFGDEVYAAGRGGGGETDYFSVARFDATGALNAQFSNDGKLNINLFEGEALADTAAMGAIVTLPVGDIVAGGSATIDGVARWVLARYNPDGTPDVSATVPPGAEVTIEFSDFPFTTDINETPFDGFDPKHTPAQMDVELNFASFAQPLSITGIALRTVTQNAQAYRFPVHDPTVAGAKWVASGGHERGTPHGNIGSQRFHWDIHAEIGGNSSLPDADPATAQTFWEGHPSGNYDTAKAYTAGELPNCQIAWGQPVYAMGSGTVVRSFNDKEDNFPIHDKTFGDGAGNSAVIDHGNGEYGVYAHMQKGSVTVTAGQFVIAGTQLGLVGNSGSSDGPHLHFGLVDAPGATSWGNSQSRPTYFIDAKFSTSSGGPVVRQLRAAPRDGEVITIDPSGIPFASPGTLYGPGLVNEVAGVHDSVATVQRLVPPVSVQGSIGSTLGTALADGGDVIEDVYRFNVTQAGTVWVRLDFTTGNDLDVLLYDSKLQAVLPAAGKSLARPETIIASLPVGVYYLCVSRYDPAGNAPVNYTLNLGVYQGGRDIYVDWEGLCAVPFGDQVCAGGWGGPFPTVKQGDEASFTGCRIFVRGGNYPESIVLRNPAVIRSYNGTATINPP
ncbi:MAG: peptidoglycan DD-metalloendopeptidase family protein [Chthoniobacteraceae bacterium]